MLRQIKSFLLSLKNTYTYLDSYTNHFLDYYMRHHKIIGWYKGWPVYSAFLTPWNSGPLANLMARRLISAITEEQLPAMASIGVTDVCNARCEHCSFYNAMDKPGKPVLNTEQMKHILQECQDFGLSVINFVGGEPLLREDLPELIAHIDKNKSASSVFTNGWMLKSKVKALKKAETMMAIVSFDGHTAEKHDNFRRLPGLFDKALEGLHAAQQEGMLTGISTTLTNEDLEDGSFKEMIHFAKEQKVNELLVFDRMPVGLYSHRVDLKQNKIDRAKLFALVDKYNARKDYPGIFTYAHLRDQSSMGCSAGRNYFYVTPYGEICPCDFVPIPIGNLLQESLPAVWKKLKQHRHNSGNEYQLDACQLTPELHPIQGLSIKEKKSSA